MSHFERVNQERWGLFPKAVLVGLMTGLIAVCFRVALEWIESQFVTIVDGFKSLGWIGMPLLFLQVLATTLLAVFIIRRLAPEASGSGIPQVKLLLLGKMSMRSLRTIIAKFASSWLAIGGGLALGREGPTLQMGAAVGQLTGKLRFTKRDEREALLICGAAAGLSAAFNAPLAGLIFALEELEVRFNQSVFFAVAVATLIADMMTRGILGEQSIFQLKNNPIQGVHQFPYALVIGAVAAIVGILFCKGIVWGSRKNRSGSKKWYFGWIVLTVGAIVLTAWYRPDGEPTAVGGGVKLTEKILDVQHSIGQLGFLLCVRFLLTILSYGVGTAGGIFAPMLTIGALLGMLIGQACQYFNLPSCPDPAIAAFIGMAGMFAAVVRCPLTGIVLLVEMTNYYPMVFVLFVSSFIAIGISDFFRQEPVYEELMAMQLEFAPHSLKTEEQDCETKQEKTN